MRFNDLVTDYALESIAKPDLQLLLHLASSVVGEASVIQGVIEKMVPHLLGCPLHLSAVG